MGTVKTEPVLVIGVLAAVLIDIAAHFNVALSTDAAESVVLNGLALVAAFVARSKVTPTD